MSYALAPQWLRTSVRTVRTSTTVLGLTLLVGLATANLVTDPSEGRAPGELGMSSVPLDDMMQHNRCSVTGFDRTVIPRSAIVRTPDGSTELVTFERGWKVFSGDAAGELVALCLGPERADAAP